MGGIGKALSAEAMSAQQMATAHACAPTGAFLDHGILWKGYSEENTGISCPRDAP
jgi:hypothetical protein